MAKADDEQGSPEVLRGLARVGVTSMKTGRRMLIISARRFFRNTTKSARSNEVRASRSGGRPRAGWS